MRHSTFPRSGVLVQSLNAFQALLPSTLISQAESLLEGHRIEDAARLADQQRKKIEGKLTIDDDESEELRYVYQRIGFQCLSETLFEDAGNNLFAGDLDPRALISYYPELRGGLFSDSDTLDVYAGVAEHMPREASIDDIIRNYSPHLSPNTRSAPPTAELRKILGFAAKEMLEKFLKKWKRKKVVDGNSETGPVDKAVDTVLAKILAEEEKTADLYTLLQEPNQVVLAEIEPVLQRTGQYNALCIIYKSRGDDGKLLEAWSKIVDGEWTDEDVKDPLSSIFNLLTEKRDRKLTQQWGRWLTKRDPERALKLLTSKETSKRKDKHEDDIAMLQQLQEESPIAGAQFLEHLVLQKRSVDPQLHKQLAASCVDQLLQCLEDETTSKLWRAKASSYASSRNESSFLTYFAATTPDSEHKRVRLKTVLFLQGSTIYDPETIRQRILEHQKVLKLELAILEGKLSNHRAALSILVHDLHDASSAEAYCTLGGEVVPGKTAQALGEKYDLTAWTSALFSLPKAKVGAVPVGRQKTVDEGLKKGLLKVLLEVYMTDGESERTAHLLNSQSMNLDVLDVIPLVPPDWPIDGMSSFLARSFRRTLHARHEGQIVKAISSGQNLQVADSSWLVLREQGALVEEAEDDDGGDGDGDDNYNEKDVLARSAVHDIVVGVVGEDDRDGIRKEVSRVDADGDPPLLR